MTVRVSKPAFNLREKLSELGDDKSVGSIETSETGRKNVIVNGAMRFNQRGAASYDAAVYTLDRWRYHRSTDGEFDIKPSTVAPPGFSNSLHVDCKAASSTISSGAYARLRYFIEGSDCQRFGKGTDEAKNLCLSFYAKSNVLGTYSVCLQDQSNSARVITRTYEVTDTDWHRYVIVFPNETAYPIANNTSTGIEIQFGLTHGTNYTGGDGGYGWSAYAENKQHTGSNVNLYSSTSNNWYLTGVQFEVGDVATPFEHLTYGEDLALCQRYYEKWGVDGTGTGTGRGPLIGCYSPGSSGVANAARFFGWLPMAVRKRTSSPIITEQSILIEHTSLGNSSHVTQIGPYMPNNGPGLTIEVNTLGGYGVAGDPYHLSFYKPNTSAGNIPYIAIDSEL